MVTKGLVASSPSRLQQNWLETTPMENNAIQQPMVTTPQSTRCPHPTKSGCPYPKGPKVLLAAFSSDHGTSESSPHPLSLERCDSGTSARSKRATCDLVHFDIPLIFFKWSQHVDRMRILKVWLDGKSMHEHKRHLAFSCKRDFPHES